MCTLTLHSRLLHLLLVWKHMWWVMLWHGSSCIIHPHHIWWRGSVLWIWETIKTTLKKDHTHSVSLSHIHIAYFKTNTVIDLIKKIEDRVQQCPSYSDLIYMMGWYWHWTHFWPNRCLRHQSMPRKQYLLYWAQDISGEKIQMNNLKQ